MKTRFPFLNSLGWKDLLSQRNRFEFVRTWKLFYSPGVKRQEFLCSIVPCFCSLRKSTFRSKTAIHRTEPRALQHLPALQQQITDHRLTHSSTTLSEDREDLHLFLASLHSATQLYHKSCTFLVLFSAKSNLGIKQHVTSF